MRYQLNHYGNLLKKLFSIKIYDCTVYRNRGNQGIVKQVIQDLWSVLEEVRKEVLEKMAAVQNLL